jgi:hypothetical protein
LAASKRCNASLGLYKPCGPPTAGQLSSRRTGAAGRTGKRPAVPTAIGRVLDQVEGRPTIGEQPAEFAVEVCILHRQPGNGLSDGRVFLGPVSSPPSKDLNSAGVEPGAHPGT